MNISKPSAGKNNAIMLCKMIGRDTQLVTEPNYGKDGQVLHCQPLTGVRADVFCSAQNARIRRTCSFAADAVMHATAAENASCHIEQCIKRTANR